MSYAKGLFYQQRGKFKMQVLTVRNAEVMDLPRILEIYQKAREFMRAAGNTTQWRNNFPPRSLLENDIKIRQLYVIEDEAGCVHGVFAFILGEDPTYQKIEQGQWRSDAAYGTLHRVAGDGTVHGILETAVAFCERKMRHLRIDTHESNKLMQHLVEKIGFKKCGIIYIEDGSPRIAYEKV
jgi:L-amino acid N-acyltransferase YncA